jgi:hypothetical protein
MSGRGHKGPSLHARTQRAQRENEPEELESDAESTARRIDVSGAFLSRVPHIVLSRPELNATDLDHREYFLISLMDGATTIETILDICGMPSDEALAILESLERRGIVQVDG